jgi:hypothetical protein
MREWVSCESQGLLTLAQSRPCRTSARTLRGSKVYFSETEVEVSSGNGSSGDLGYWTTAFL